MVPSKQTHSLKRSKRLLTVSSWSTAVSIGRNLLLRCSDHTLSLMCLVKQQKGDQHRQHTAGAGAERAPG